MIIFPSESSLEPLIKERAMRLINNSNLADLEEEGLNPKIQKSMDILRVIGNNAVHPGQIDLKDDHDTAIKLFDIINLIAQDMITTPKQIENMYSALPKEALEAIKKRDEK